MATRSGGRTRRRGTARRRRRTAKPAVVRTRRLRIAGGNARTATERTRTVNGRDARTGRVLTRDRDGNL